MESPYCRQCPVLALFRASAGVLPVRQRGTTWLIVVSQSCGDPMVRSHFKKEHCFMKTVAWLVGGAIALALGWHFVLNPVLNMFAEQDFQEEVREYLVAVEPAIVESAFDEFNTDKKKTGFHEKLEHQRMRLIDRMSHLRAGGATQFSSWEKDSWSRVHRDIFDEVAHGARLRASEKHGTYDLPWKTVQPFLPDGWEKRSAIRELHYKLKSVASGYRTPLAERREAFVEMSEKMDQLMNELNIKKR